MKHSFFKWLMVSAALGLLAPISWFLVQMLLGGNAQLESQIAYPLERVIRVVWPSSFWLMATDGIETTPTAYLFIFMSVAANVILYAVVGSAVWRLRHLSKRDKS
jgi:hypothetical protein